MQKYSGKIIAVVAIVLLLGAVIAEESFARAGGSRSIGSRGTRSYAPSRSYQSPQPAPQQPAPGQPGPSPYQPQGGFLRSMAGGLVGGMLGGMLFRGLFGGGMGGGFGLLDILLVAGIGYMIFRLLRGRAQRSAQSDQPYQPQDYTPREKVTQLYPSGGDERATGLGYIRQMDSTFDETRFKDGVMDIFFKVQSAWMNRDLAPVAGLLTDEVQRIFQDDINRLLRDRQINRLENIAVRSVDITEAWQEAGQDYITTLVYANLLDYTVDDASGQVVAGSKTDPVKFEEFWTFTRPVGNNAWRLSAIHQV